MVSRVPNHPGLPGSSHGHGLAAHKTSTCLRARSCRALWDPVHCSPPGSSVHGIFQARILEWVAISFSRGSPPSPKLYPHLLTLLQRQTDSLPLCHLGSPSKGWFFLHRVSSVSPGHGLLLDMKSSGHGFNSLYQTLQYSFILLECSSWIFSSLDIITSFFPRFTPIPHFVSVCMYIYILKYSWFAILF